MPLNRLPLAEQTYQLLLEEIIAGKRPAGGRISEESICAELGISRTPAREALMRLASEGLIERTARKGCRVNSIDRDQQRDLFECRAALEVLALKLAFKRIPADRLADIAKRLERAKRGNDSAGSLEADAMLHELIIASCPNRTLGETIARLLHQCNAFRALRAASTNVRALTQERLAIVRAIERGEKAAAGRLLADHIRQGVPD
jgi:DNA-binding GntR family transcriptional regulator